MQEILQYIKIQLSYIDSNTGTKILKIKYMFNSKQKINFNQKSFRFHNFSKKYSNSNIKFKIFSNFTIENYDRRSVISNIAYFQTIV